MKYIDKLITALQTLSKTLDEILPKLKELGNVIEKADK